MESQGLIACERSERDQRVVNAVITDDGRRMIEAITRARRRLFDKLLADWSDADRREAARLNRKLADAMTKARLSLS